MSSPLCSIGLRQTFRGPEGVLSPRYSRSPISKLSINLKVQMNPKGTVGSTLALRTVAMPAFSNSHGDIFGGWLLSQMDLAGGTVATRRAKGRVVTVAVTSMIFQRPVFVGDEVTCYAEAIKIGRSSITIKINAFARRGRTGEDIEVTEGAFTYVAVDTEGKPRPISSSI
jgi:acyl-CoA thioesterase YciA